MPKNGSLRPDSSNTSENFYWSWASASLSWEASTRSKSRAKIIGLILCRTKKELVVEYALRGTTNPMGISEFTHLEKLPMELKGSLPTVEELEAELGMDPGDAR